MSRFTTAKNVRRAARNFVTNDRETDSRLVNKGMQESTDFSDLVRKARTGDKGSLNELADLAGQRLSVYIQRIALRHDVTQDIVQESLIEMFKFLDKLEKEDRFWPWLRKIAINKLHHHYAREKSHRMASISDVEHTIADADRQEGIAGMVGDELRHVVIDSMAGLKPRYREVLVMRCYEEMDYDQIAQELGSTEFSARVLFFRAKNALAKQLTRRGLGKGALLGALVLFGKLTAPSKAAAAQITVTAATTKVGLTAAAAAVVVSGKAAVVTMTAAAIIAVAPAVIPTNDPSAYSPTTLVAGNTSLRSIAGQPVNNCWFFYPEGANGPVMMRQTRPIGSGSQSVCQWLQNDDANYHYDLGRNTVTINNYHMWDPDLSVARLPTDSPQLSAFLTRMDGKTFRFDPISKIEKGTLVIAREEADEPTRSWSTQHINVLNEDYFQCDWPEGVVVTDQRDEMHKVGWTYFRMTGQIGGQPVTGTGTMPLIYSAVQQVAPTLQLRIGDRIQIADGLDGTWRQDQQQKVRTTYPRGSFFDGLARPWMGLHTVDIIRRDAAVRQVEFQTRLSHDRNRSQVMAFSGNLRVVYTIDMNQDWIESISLAVRQPSGEWKDTGLLSFAYEQLSSSQDLRIDTRSVQGRETAASPGIQWLMTLAGTGDAG
jgi:RNA polymerase sigma-70 factor (ECF subfamily)